MPASRFLFVALFLLVNLGSVEEIDMNFKNLVVIVSGFNTCCSDSLWQSQSQNGKLKVMTTFYPVYDFYKILLEMNGRPAHWARIRAS